MKIVKYLMKNSRFVKIYIICKKLKNKFQKEKIMLKKVMIKYYNNDNNLDHNN